MASPPLPSAWNHPMRLLVPSPEVQVPAGEHTAQAGPSTLPCLPGTPGALGQQPPGAWMSAPRSVATGLVLPPRSGQWQILCIPSKSWEPLIFQRPTCFLRARDNVASWLPGFALGRRKLCPWRPPASRSAGQNRALAGASGSGGDQGPAPLTYGTCCSDSACRSSSHMST